MTTEQAKNIQQAVQAAKDKPPQRTPIQQAAANVMSKMALVKPPQKKKKPFKK